jgi:hypothetical protein
MRESKSGYYEGNSDKTSILHGVRVSAIIVVAVSIVLFLWIEEGCLARTFLGVLQLLSRYG